MAISSHRICSIHGSFGPTFAASSAISAAQASSFNQLPNVSVGAHGRPPTPNLFYLSARAGSVASPHATMILGSRARRAPPLPPCRQPRTTVGSRTEEDPFADQPIIEIVRPASRTSLSSTPSTIASRTRIPPPAIDTSNTTPSAPSPQAAAPLVTIVIPPGIEPVSTLPEFGRAEARGRLVACVLLNRNCGRPMRRRRSGIMASQTYIPSGLSRTVEVETAA